MKPYQPLQYPNNEPIWFVIAVRKPHWQYSPDNQSRIPEELVAGSVSWNLYPLSDSHGVQHLENNRHGVNFDSSCFKQITQEKYHEILEQQLQWESIEELHSNLGDIEFLREHPLILHKLIELSRDKSLAPFINNKASGYDEGGIDWEGESSGGYPWNQIMAGNIDAFYQH